MQPAQKSEDRCRVKSGAPREKRYRMPNLLGGCSSRHQKLHESLDGQPQGARSHYLFITIIAVRQNWIRYKGQNYQSDSAKFNHATISPEQTLPSHAHTVTSPPLPPPGNACLQTSYPLPSSGLTASPLCEFLNLLYVQHRCDEQCSGKQTTDPLKYST